MKKFLVFIISLVSINIFGAENSYSTQIGGIYYTLDTYHSSATVSWYRHTMGPGGESWGAPAYQGDIVIPDKIEYEGCVYQIKNIDLCAFQVYIYQGENSLESITIPASITSIHGQALRSSAFERIEDLYYEPCLKKMSIPSWDWWFEIAPTRKGLHSGYWKLDVVDDFIGVADHLFVGGVECDLSNFVFPQDKTIVPKNTFRAVKKLKQITLPNTLKTIGDYAFYDAGLTSVEIPVDVESIGDMAFALCTEIKKIVIPDHVRYLGTGVFCGCANLTSLTIGRNWNQETNLFDGINGELPSLKIIVSKITEPKDLNFAGRAWYWPTGDEATLYVPIGTKEAYLKCKGWNEISNIVEGEPNNSDPTEIHKPQTVSKETDMRVFTLDGRIVNNKVLKPGVYIKGRKIFMVSAPIKIK